MDFTDSRRTRARFFPIDMASIRQEISRFIITQVDTPGIEVIGDAPIFLVGLEVERPMLVEIMSQVRNELNQLHFANHPTGIHVQYIDRGLALIGTGQPTNPNLLTPVDIATPIYWATPDSRKTNLRPPIFFLSEQVQAGITNLAHGFAKGKEILANPEIEEGVTFEREVEFVDVDSPTV